MIFKKDLKIQATHNKESFKNMIRIPDLNDWRLAIGLVRPNSKVLSIGCGSGREVRYLSSIGCNVTAIDIDKACINESKRIEPRAEYVLQDFLKYKTNKKFDFVLCLNRTINYLLDNKDKKELIRKAVSYLDSKGQLIVSTSHRYSSLRKFLVWLFDKNQRRYYFSPRKIKTWFNGLPILIYQIKVEGTLIMKIKKKNNP